MEDTDFEFETEVREPRITEPSRKRTDNRKRGFVASFTDDNYGGFDENGDYSGTSIMPLEDGIYVVDEYCNNRLIPGDEWYEHLMEEHLIIGESIPTTSSPSKDF